MLDVRRLRVLREVASRGSFSAAADALHFTQSAVSQQIAALEREAGTTLVERNARGVRLTEAGEAYANLRQPNLYATLCWIGAGVVLFGTLRLPFLAAAIVIALLAAGSAASVSRTGMLQGLVLTGLAAIWSGPTLPSAIPATNRSISTGASAAPSRLRRMISCGSAEGLGAPAVGPASGIVARPEEGAE